MKKYAYYPGCNTTGLSKELDISMRAIAPLLDIELVEIPEFVCCGAGAVRETDHIAELALNMRNFSLAHKQNLPILTVCATCQGTMKRALWELSYDARLLKAVIKRVEGLGYRVEECLGVEVKHILEVLFEEEGKKRAARCQVPDIRIKVAPFYGCRLLRPSSYMDFDDAVHPHKFEDVLSSFGYEVVEYEGRTKCCGFDIAFVDRQAALSILEQRMQEAEQCGADVIVTACPLCQNMLDGFQKEVTKSFSSGWRIPILHLSQAVGLSFGLQPKQLGLKRHIVAFREFG